MDLLLETIQQIYECVSNPELWPELLQTLADVTGGRGTLILPLQAGFDVDPIWSPSLDESVATYQEQGWWERDSRILRAQALNLTHGVFCDQDFVPPEIRSRDAFYQEFLRPREFGSMLCMITKAPGGPRLSIGVQRGLDGGAFQKKDRQKFQVLAPHIQRAILAGSTLAAARLDNHVQEIARERQANGYILLDHRGHVLHADVMAMALFGSVFSVMNGKLVASRQADRTKLEYLVDSVLPGKSMPIGPVSLSQPGRAGRYIVQAVPIRPNGPAFAKLAARARAMVLVHDIGLDQTTNVVNLLTTMGLTAGQARVAEKLGLGLSNREAAFALGLSEQTIRSVAKSIFERLEISKQSQLAVIITKLQNVR